MNREIQNMRESLAYCHEPSPKYLRLLEEMGDDPRSVSGIRALRRVQSIGNRAWIGDYDSRLA